MPPPLPIAPQSVRIPTPEVRRSVIARLHERVLQGSGELEPDAPTVRSATILLAAEVIGQNVDRLALLTGYPREFVARCARRLVDNGVWVNGRTASAWRGCEVDSLAFWADVGVAEGKLCRRVGPEGRLEWAPAGHWHKSYDYLRRADSETCIRYHEPTIHEPLPVAPADSAGDSSPAVRAEADPAPARPALRRAPSMHPRSGAGRPAGRSEVRPLGSPDLFTDTVWLT